MTGEAELMTGIPTGKFCCRDIPGGFIFHRGGSQLKEDRFIPRCVNVKD